MKKLLLNQRAQSLVEYLVIVSLLAIGSIAVVRGLGQTIYVRFANITNALQNKNPEIQPTALKESDYNKKSLSDFFKGSTTEGESH